jgi:NDP-sugar pyrophosphorylase family protein
MGGIGCLAIDARFIASHQERRVVREARLEEEGMQVSLTEPVGAPYRAFVLAGGLGLRLRTVVDDLPKVLAPVGGRPFLDYILCQLARSDVRRITLCTGYGDAAVRAFAGDGSRWGVAVSYSLESAPLGTAGAVRNAWAAGDEDRALVLNGDSFFDVPLADLVERHRAGGASATIAAHETDDAGRFGSLELGDDGEVLAFREKATGGRAAINGGIYVLERAALDGVEPGRTASIERDVFPALVTRRSSGPALRAYAYPGFFVDIGVPEDYARVNRDPSPIQHALEETIRC